MQNFKTLASKAKELLRFKVKVAPRIADRALRIARAEILAYRRSLRSLKICKKILETSFKLTGNSEDPYFRVEVYKNLDLTDLLETDGVYDRNP